MGRLAGRASGRLLSRSPNWGSAALGVASGLIGGIVLSVPLIALGWAGTDSVAGQAVLIVVGLMAQIAAGYVAGRLASDRKPQTGALAGFGLFAIVSAIAIAAGEDPSLFTIGFGMVVAFVMGLVGGALGEMGSPESRSPQ